MKKCTIIFVFLALSFHLIAQPTTITYQGKLLDASGNAITQNNVAMTFVMFDASTAGNQLWPASGVVTKTINVVQGLYSVELGTGTAPDIAFTAAMFEGKTPWLEVVVGVETLPRTEITNVPFALISNDLSASGWENPGEIGKTTPNTGKFTTVETGSIKITGGTPANGNVLTSDNDGVASWVTPSTTAVNFSGNLSGDVSGTQSATVIGNDKVTNTMLAGSISDSKLNTISTAGKVSNSATTATSSNTASSIVARDASGNFAAGTITASLTGDVTGNASTATAATTATHIAGGAEGSIPYQTASGTTTLLAKGTAGQVLNMNAEATAPEWKTLSKSDIGLGNVENTALSTWTGTSNLTTLGTITTGTWNGTTLSLAKGGTGATTKTAAFDALSPMSAAGDIVYGGTNGTGTRLAKGTAGQVLAMNTGATAPEWITPASGTVTSVTGTAPITSSGGNTPDISISEATTSAAGSMSAADKTKLDGIEASANNYSHPTGDGNLHVPATGTTSNGKVLTAGAAAGSLSWGTITESQTLANVAALGNSVDAQIKNVTDPTEDQDAATKAYVDVLLAQIEGLLAREESWLLSNGFKDPRDNNTYNIVKIGTQLWMAENLAFLPSVVGLATGSGTTSYYYVYGYDGTDVTAAKATSNYSNYGVLYNWTAAQTACPSGWHLPTDAEWTILSDYLGGIDVAGGKLKSTGTTYWESPNYGATNESGFSGLPGGAFRDYDDQFSSIKQIGLWWSATECDVYTTHAWYRSVNTYGTYWNQSWNGKNDGMAIRCLRDE